MKKVEIIILMLLISFPGVTQSNNQSYEDSMYAWMAANSDTTTKQWERLTSLKILNQTQYLGSEHEEWWVSQIFFKVHARYLKKYVPLSTLPELYQEGYYDCVTGTLLYAWLYEQAGFEVSIKEGNFHAYLVIKGQNNSYLIEATDPYSGLTTGDDAIKSLEEEYEDKNEEQFRLAVEDGEIAEFVKEESIFNAVDLATFRGIYHYNLAVKSYNLQNLAGASREISRALSYYQHPRVMGFNELINDYQVTQRAQFLSGTYKQPD